MPFWLVILVWISLATGIISALVILLHLAGRPQKMWIMNIVWPVTALYGSLPALWLYFHIGRRSAKDMHGLPKPRVGLEGEPRGKEKPFPATVAVAATHCGADARSATSLPNGPSSLAR